MHYNIVAERRYTCAFIHVFVFSISSSSSSLKFLEWPKQQRHHEDHYSQSSLSTAVSDSVVTEAE